MWQGGGTWSSVCPHRPRIHCHSWITTRWRHSEQVSDAECVCVLLYVCVHLLPWKLQHVTYVFYRRNCIISAYYQQRETHKPTLPNVSRNHIIKPYATISMCTCKITIISSIACSGPGRLLKSPAGFCLWGSSEGLSVLRLLCAI